MDVQPRGYQCQYVFPSSYRQSAACSSHCFRLGDCRVRGIRCGDMGSHLQNLARATRHGQPSPVRILDERGDDRCCRASHCICCRSSSPLASRLRRPRVAACRIAIWHRAAAAVTTLPSRKSAAAHAARNLRASIPGAYEAVTKLVSPLTRLAFFPPERGLPPPPNIIPPRCGWFHG